MKNGYGLNLSFDWRWQIEHTAQLGTPPRRATLLLLAGAVAGLLAAPLAGVCRRVKIRSPSSSSWTRLEVLRGVSRGYSSAGFSSVAVIWWEMLAAMVCSVELKAGRDAERFVFDSKLGNARLVLAAVRG